MTIIFIVLGAYLVVMLLFLLMLVTTHRKISQGKALIRGGFGGIKVARNVGMFVFPLFHKGEEMDISLKKIEIKCVGADALLCKDNILADIEAIFFIRVRETLEDILHVAQTLGCAAASDQQTLEDLFKLQFIEAMRVAAADVNFNGFYANLDQFKSNVLQYIGDDLNGFELDSFTVFAAKIHS